MPKLHLTLLCGLVLPLCLVTSPASAALFWHHGVQSNDISVCFVGDSYARNTDFAELVMEYMQEYEWYSGIHFTFLNECPDVVITGVPPRAYYGGTIRIIIPGVTTVSPFGWVPGLGCPHDPNWENSDGTYNGGNDGWGSWANPPDELEFRRSCVYNVKLGTDGDASGTPWRNHTLHEIGHSLGLAHEHVRNDVDPACTAADYGGDADTGFMTPYDRHSVMHYRFAACDIDGNYGHSGLSAWDQLAVHILYPERAPIAEFIGSLVIRAGDTLSLASAWQSRGAIINNVAANFLWTLNGDLAGFGPNLNVVLPNPGVHSLRYSYGDNLPTVPTRFYSHSNVVRVLSDADYDRLMGALASINTMLTATGTEDGDSDGIPDIFDNCLLASNAGQGDTDNDGIGNACDADIAIPGDCFVNFLDLQVMSNAFFSAPGTGGWNPDADFNGDNAVNFADLQLMRTQFFGPPGPSANGCN